MGCTNGGRASRWFGGVPVVERDPAENTRVLRSFGFGAEAVAPAPRPPVTWDAEENRRVLRSFGFGGEAGAPAPRPPVTWAADEDRRVLRSFGFGAGAARQISQSEGPSARALRSFLGSGASSSQRRSGPTAGVRRPAGGTVEGSERLAEIASANRCCGELPPLSEDGAYREGEPSELCGSTDEILEGFTDWHIDGGQCVASVMCRDQSRNAANCDCMIGGADVADRMAVCGGGGSDIPLGFPVEGVDDPVAATYDPATGGCWLLYTCEDGGRWVLSASQCPYVGESYTQPTQFYDHRQDVPECGGGGATDPLVDDDPSGDGAEGPEWVGMAITGAVTRPWWGVPAVDWGALAAGGLRLAGLAALGLLEGHGPRRRTCSRDFPAYTPCWAIDDWRYGSAEDKARSFGPGCKAVKPESTFNAYCAGEVTHWNIRCGGVFVNSVLCCQCCDDERTPGSAYLRTACR